MALYNLSAGGLASIDGPSLNGAKLMAKQINDAGGCSAGEMIELTAIDTKNDQKEAATGAKRAVSMEGVVAGIGHSDTTFALASAPLFQAQGIPFEHPRHLARPAGHGRQPDVPRLLRRRCPGMQWPNTPITRSA